MTIYANIYIDNVVFDTYNISIDAVIIRPYFECKTKLHIKKRHNMNRFSAYNIYLISSITDILFFSCRW